ncbi:hypothetical protein FA15DRAFT_760110 [Coprinopsis marcescibilis]|uniref:G domain-containing protein n=1 Tax=Coprinopsis marcescibilis TaxID=230819 RepID=A0A5C3KGL6_COPMA|nr:hypothetical protein FA15DRAFT_760110 [Coprinopsis marcescibilis]
MEKSSVSWIPLQNDLIVVVVGQTGSGKSTIINWIAGDDLASIHHGLTPQCTSISPIVIPSGRMFSSHLQGKRLVLVEVPGFNQGDVDDEDIWSRLRYWVGKNYGPRRRVDAILFIHDISQQRIHTSKNFMNRERYIQILKDAASNLHRLLFLTTFWQIPPIKLDETREKEFLEEFIEDPLSEGALVERLIIEREDANDFVLSKLLPRIMDPTRTCIVLLLGRTGIGKSTFANMVAENEVQRVGHGLTSCTRTVGAIPCTKHSNPAWQLQLVDTPGFDNSETSSMTDATIWDMICQWTEGQPPGLVFAGIIYFETPTDTLDCKRSHQKLLQHSVLGPRTRTIAVPLDSEKSRIDLSEVTEFAPQALEMLRSMVDNADPELTISNASSALRSVAPKSRERKVSILHWLSSFRIFSLFFS